jgi:hypothetical protein
MKITKLPQIDLVLFDKNDFLTLISKYTLPMFEYQDLANKQGWYLTIYQNKFVGVNYRLP